MVDADMESDLAEFLDVFDAVELLRVIGVIPEPLRAGTGIAACVGGFFWSGREESGVAEVEVVAAVLVVGSFIEPPLPGRGKWFRLGSVPTIVSWKSSKLKVGSRKLPKSKVALRP